MNIIILVVLIIILILLKNRNEQFTNIDSECCIVTKNFNNGEFKYNIRKINNCEKYNIADSNSMVFYDKKICNQETEIGSCRYANKECFDFMTKEKCSKINDNCFNYYTKEKCEPFEWYEKSCNDPLPFVYKDKIRYKKPENKDDGSIIMF